MKGIVPFLMFSERAHEAMKFYCSVFRNSRIVSLSRQGKRVMGGSFKLGPTLIHCYEGGSYFSFSQGISLMVPCKTQREIDHLWAALTADGGEEQQCGWLRDKFGVSWQITPDVLLKYINDKDPERAGRVIQAMLKMQKLDIAALKAAYKGK